MDYPIVQICVYFYPRSSKELDKWSKEPTEDKRGCS